MTPIEYVMADHEFQTPRGNMATMHYRLATSDWNTIYAVMMADEYHLKDLALAGLAVDIGAHVGSVGIALALDNPDLKVICVEPVPENYTLLRQNILANNLNDRVYAIWGAAATGEVSTKVRWRYRGSPTADHHAFIGNTALVEGAGATGVEFEEREVMCYPLEAIWRTFGPIMFLKIDCEGCEWSALADPKADHIPIIHGEWHGVCGKKRDDLYGLLPAHKIVFEGPEAGPGGFRATL